MSKKYENLLHLELKHLNVATKNQRLDFPLEIPHVKEKQHITFLYHFECLGSLLLFFPVRAASIETYVTVTVCVPPGELRISIDGLTHSKKPRREFFGIRSQRRWFHIIVSRTEGKL